MPAHAPDTPISSHFATELNQGNVACPHPSTPPPETNSNCPFDRAITRATSSRQVSGGRHGVSDNTAAGMTLSQEESMYTNEQDFPEERRRVDHVRDERKRIDGPNDEMCDESITLTNTMDLNDPKSSTIEAAEASSADCQTQDGKLPPGTSEAVPDGSASLPSPPADNILEDWKRDFYGTVDRPGIPPIDQELEWSNSINFYDPARKRPAPQYPSATLQPHSVFKGTQQSDRQIYNVEVTVLTVDMEEASMSGYLQICGLTPDHPTLTTFFTGDIIGGPNQKHSFRTADSAWGASDKTDLIHWARFPAWRPLSLQAKRNIDFVYPSNHENWWQQEHIFMRWKEHFLVPDYKLKSIQGASFEGFYYICFNQVEGRVSGIYFHKKSER
jgi:hypothetical protein